MVGETIQLCAAQDRRLHLTSAERETEVIHDFMIAFETYEEGRKKLTKPFQFRRH
jgi:hypothetical protein